MNIIPFPTCHHDMLVAALKPALPLEPKAILVVCREVVRDCSVAQAARACLDACAAA